MLPRLFEQRRHVLALIRDRRALGIVLVITAGRPARGAGDDRVELTLEFGDAAHSLVAIVVKPLSRAFGLPYHLDAKNPGPARNYS